MKLPTLITSLLATTTTISALPTPSVASIPQTQALALPVIPPQIDYATILKQKLHKLFQGKTLSNAELINLSRSSLSEFLLFLVLKNSLTIEEANVYREVMQKKVDEMHKNDKLNIADIIYWLLDDVYWTALRKRADTDEEVKSTIPWVLDDEWIWTMLGKRAEPKPISHYGEQTPQYSEHGTVPRGASAPGDWLPESFGGEPFGGAKPV